MRFYVENEHNEWLGEKINKKVDKIRYAKCLSFYCSVRKPNIFLFDVNIKSHVLRTCSKVIEKIKT